METNNMITLTVKQFVKIIREKIEDGNISPTLGLGKAGIGKTEAIRSLAEELGIGYKEIRLINHTETDLIGIPYLEQNQNVKVTKFANNSLLPSAEIDGEEGILVLDEITSASINMRTLAYQLLDVSRGVGQYKLPEKWIVVALGNGIDDGGNYQGMESALLNRCECVRVDADYKTWKEWASNHGVNPSVIAFLGFQPDALHKLDTSEEVEVFPSPRSWTALSKKLNSREAKNNGMPLDEEDVTIYAACCVGLKMAHKFSAFYKYKKVMVSVEQILSGEADTGGKRIETEVMYLLTQSLVSQMKKEIELGKTGPYEFSDELLIRTGNACKWIISVGRNRMLDLAMMMIREMGEQLPDLINIIGNSKFAKICPDFMEFCDENNLWDN